MATLPAPNLRAVLRRFARSHGAGAATEFALVGLWAIGLMFVILNLALLSFSLASLARGVQGAARAAAVYTVNQYVTSGTTFTCASASTITGYFNQYAQPGLPAANTNPLVTATWKNTNSGGTGNGIYLTLTGTYTWRPMGFKLLNANGITFKITTVATVPGSVPNSTSSPAYNPTVDSASCPS